MNETIILVPHSPMFQIEHNKEGDKKDGAKKEVG